MALKHYALLTSDGSFTSGSSRITEKCFRPRVLVAKAFVFANHFANKFGAGYNLNLNSPNVGKFFFPDANIAMCLCAKAVAATLRCTKRSANC